MGTYRNPGSTPGISIAGEISTGISEISQTGRKKRDLVNKFQKEALEEKRKQQDLIDQLEDVDEKNPINSMLESFNGRVDEAYNMKLKSFGGDTSEYDKHYQDTQKILEDIIPATGIIDKTIEDFNKMSPSERNKAILRSPFVGEDADKRNKYKALLEDPSKMGYKFKGDKIIITYDNEELFNASALINATKKGFSLLEKATDYSPELKIVGDEAYQNLANLKTIQSIEKKDKNIITAEEKVLYSDAIEEFERRLRAEENSKLQALVNESNYQRFTTGDEVFDVNRDGKETKEAIIAHLVKNKFPQGKELISKTKQKEDYLTEAQEEKFKQSGKRLAFEKEKFKAQQAAKKEKNPREIYTLNTREQIATLDNDYNRLINSFNPDPDKTFGNIDNPKFVAEVLNETSPDKISYVTYEDIISDDPSFEGEIQKDKIYIRKENGEKYEFITKNPISIGENELFNLVSIKADDSGYRKAAKEHFRSKYEKQGTNNKPNNNDSTSTKKVSTNDEVESQDQEKEIKAKLSKVNKITKEDFEKVAPGKDFSQYKQAMKDLLKLDTVYALEKDEVQKILNKLLKRTIL